MSVRRVHRDAKHSKRKKKKYFKRVKSGMISAICYCVCFFYLFAIEMYGKCRRMQTSGNAKAVHRVGKSLQITPKNFCFCSTFSPNPLHSASSHTHLHTDTNTPTVRPDPGTGTVRRLYFASRRRPVVPRDRPNIPKHIVCMPWIIQSCR